MPFRGSSDELELEELDEYELELLELELVEDELLPVELAEEEASELEDELAPAPEQAAKKGSSNTANRNVFFFLMKEIINHRAGK